jgi:hypothetical protein
MRRSRPGLRLGGFFLHRAKEEKMRRNRLGLKPGGFFMRGKKEPRSRIIRKCKRRERKKEKDKEE